MQLFKCFLCALASTMAFADQVKFEDCGNKEILQVKISGCNLSEDVCRVTYRNPIKIETHFVANQNTRYVVLDMTASKWPLRFKVPELHQNGCDGHNLTCPLKEGEQQVYTHTYQVPSYVPRKTATIRAEFFGEKGSLGCFEIEGELIN